MKIDIYKSTKSGKKYLSVPAGTDVEKLQLPDSVDPDILSLSPFKTSLELDPSQPLIALDPQDVINQINEKGYAIHGAKVEIQIQTKKS
jgi:uncharacterized protein YcgL (UPF0745 family)